MQTSGARMRLVIAGAAGRDFHDFNVVYRHDPRCEVVAFTAAQIPGIAGRRYPPGLAGPLYPEGIPIVDESGLEALVRRERVDAVVLAYSDLSHPAAMHIASRVLACGADFLLLGPDRTMLEPAVPAIAVSAVRTGAGKSPVSRWLSARLRASGLRVAVVRHPMPYGDLQSRAAQRFATLADLEREGCTIEEREEYEPHLASGSTVHAGVDYARVLADAARGVDLIVWDGGNNDFPFVRPAMHIVLADPLRPGDELSHHPGETCLRMADVIVLSKCDSAAADAVSRVRANCRGANPGARIVRGALPLRLDDAAAVRGKRVLVVEDGPTITHGGMPHGAGFIAAQRAGAAAIVDPRRWADGAIAQAYARYRHIGPVLPALGYSGEQVDALRRTIDASDADIVISATPIDLARLLRPGKPVLRVRYAFEDLDAPDGLWDAVERFLDARGLRAPGAPAAA